MEYSETIPIQYQEGKAVFMGMDIAVNTKVLIPRPETEMLIEVAVRLCREKSITKPYILDIGTGSGNVPLGLIKLINDCHIVGTDISLDALGMAGQNLRRFSCADRVSLVAADMFSSFSKNRRYLFDCIISNPPYVSTNSYSMLDNWVRAEPKIALYAGSDGMDYLNIIIEESMRFLSPRGFVVVEIGYDQVKKVKEKFKECGFSGISAFKDFNNYERVIAAHKTLEKCYG